MARDIIDAEFETIRRDDGRHPMSAGARGDSPRESGETAVAKLDAARRREDVAPPPMDMRESDQIDILRDDRKDDVHQPGRKAQILYALSVLFSAFLAFYLSGGHVLFHGVPPVQGPAALALEMTPAPGSAARRPSDDVVTVSATIRNGSPGETRVPDILLTFTGGEAGDLVYRVPRGETLGPGKSLAFTVRMPKKPGYAEAPRLAFDNSGV